MSRNEGQIKGGIKRSFVTNNHLNYHTMTNNAVFPHDPDNQEAPQVQHFHTKHTSITKRPELQPTIRELQGN